MKVLHLSSERTWRGGEQQIAYLIQGSIKNNIETHVAARKDSAFSVFCKDTDIPLIEVGFKNEIDFITALKINRYCKQHHIDIIHMHSSHSHAIGVWSKVLGNTAKLILSRRVDFPVKPNWASNYKFNHPKIDAIICISEKIKEILHPDINRKNILHTVHSGIDITKFKSARNNHLLHTEFNLPKDIKLVGNISAIADHKDYFTFVDTAERVIKSRNDIKFIIIGDGPMTEEIKDYVLQKNMKKHIIFTGFRDDVIDIIQELDVFLMTSKTEGLGTTILDAFANRIPVVATKAGGIPESVIDHKTGLLADIGDSKKLAQHITTILDDDKLRGELRENAFTRLSKKFTIDTMVKGNLEIYREVLQKSN